MFKMVFLLKRKPGMTVDAFKEYYEGTHAKLGERVLPTAERYIRRYLTPYPDSTCEGDVDVITEIWFKDKTTAEAAIESISRPDVAAEIAADEENVLDRSLIRLFVVEEHESDLGRQ